MEILSYFKLNRDQALPLYQQLIDGMTRMCREQPPGTRLPNERELCTSIGCSRNILRQALEHMVDHGMLERRRPIGTFIAQRHTGRKILVVHPEVNDITQAWQYILPGVEAAARERGFEVIKIGLAFIRSGDCVEKRETLRSLDLSGVILLPAGYLGDEPEITIFRDMGIPVLLTMGRDYDQVTTPFLVMPDVVRRAFCAGIQFLRQCGHTRIATISDRNADPSGIRGLTPHEFSALLHYNHDTKPPFHNLHHVTFDFAEIDRVVGRLWESPERPSVIFCYSDFYAIKVLESLKQRGIRVPEDISVMGFCGYPGGNLLTPALTTVSLCYEKRGRAAVDFLAGGVFTDEALPRVGYEIIERASVKHLNQ